MERWSIHSNMKSAAEKNIIKIFNKRVLLTIKYAYARCGAAVYIPRNAIARVPRLREMRQIWIYKVNSYFTHVYGQDDIQLVSSCEQWFYERCLMLFTSSTIIAYHIYEDVQTTHAQSVLNFSARSCADVSTTLLKCDLTWNV